MAVRVKFQADPAHRETLDGPPVRKVYRSERSDIAKACENNQKYEQSNSNRFDIYQCAKLAGDVCAMFVRSPVTKTGAHGGQWFQIIEMIMNNIDDFH